MKKYTLLSLWVCGKLLYFVVYVGSMVVIVCSVVALCYIVYSFVVTVECAKTTPGALLVKLNSPTWIYDLYL